MTMPQTMKDRLKAKIEEAFHPSALVVDDESHQHAGHAGWREGGETHFRLYIVADAFAGKSRVERHRMVNALLADELAGGIHALAIAAKSSVRPRPRDAAPTSGSRTVGGSRSGIVSFGRTGFAAAT